MALIRPLVLCADDLLSKWGFSDGDILSDWWWDAFDEWPDFDDHDVLANLIETHLLPLLTARGYDVKLVRIDTIHNPIRAEYVGGAEVNWYQPGDADWGDDIRVSLTLAEIEAAIDRVVR